MVAERIRKSVEKVTFDGEIAHVKLPSASEYRHFPRKVWSRRPR
jgi:hypothetical protein